MRRMKMSILAWVLLLTTAVNAKIIYVSAQAGDSLLPAWQAGMMDIHNINTGCGNCTFCVLPDGTTMLIDAGHNNSNSVRHVPAVPNDTKSPARWIVDYLNAFSPAGRAPQLDYVLATHFDSDHIGGVMKTKSTHADYFLTGISEVVEHIPAHKIIDRGYPNYNVEPPTNESQYTNWRKFTAYQLTQQPNIMENFRVGSNTQFVLRYDSTHTYANRFEIRNMIANGVMWTGEDSTTINLLPNNLETLSSSDKPEENTLSCGIRISYGRFDYWNGGDLTGYPKPGRPTWHDMETPLAPIMGVTEVCNVNHHGYDNATNGTWLKTIAPQVLIIQASDALHPNHSTLYRMLAKPLYTPADIFSTNMHSAARIVIGDLVDAMKSTQGHIVIRVSNGGSDYMVYVLDDADTTNYKIKQSFGPYFCVR